MQDTVKKEIAMADKNIAERDRYNQLLERLRIIDDEINSFNRKREYEPTRNLEREREQIRKELEKFSEQEGGEG